MFHRQGCSAACAYAVAMIAGSAAHAGMMIDDFTVPQTPGPISASGGFSDTTVSQASPDLLGSRRRMTIQTLSGTGTVTQVASNGAYRLEKPAGTGTTSSLHWEGSGSPGFLGGLNLTEGGAADRFEIVGSTTGPVTIELIAFSTVEFPVLQIARFAVNIQSATSFRLIMPFTGFIPDSGATAADFTNIRRLIGGVHSQGTSGPAQSVTIDYIQTIPTPAGAFSLGMGALAMVRRRR